MKTDRLIPLFVLLVSACASNGSASFDADVEGDECLAQMFPFDPIFVAARERGGGFGLFYQSEGGNFQDKDVMYIEILDVDSAEAGDALPFSLPGTIDARATGEIEVGESCPEHPESYYLEGEVDFDSFETESRSDIKGTLQDVEVFRFRDRVRVASSLRGEFEIVLRRGPPFEEFIE